MRHRLLRTAFLTALLSYLGFLFVEYLEPGFVSNSFSVHIIGALAAVLGVAWYPTAEREKKVGKIVPVVLGLIGALIVWNEGTMFGDFRALFAVGVLVLPLLSSRLLLRSP